MNISVYFLRVLKKQRQRELVKKEKGIKKGSIKVGDGCLKYSLSFKIEKK